MSRQLDSQALDAVKKGDLSQLVAALDAGAAIELPDQHGFSGVPLRTACFLGHEALVRELLRRGADVSAANSDGPGAPVRMALRGKRQAIVSLLLEYGASLPVAAPPLPVVLEVPEGPVSSAGNAAEARSTDFPVLPPTAESLSPAVSPESVAAASPVDELAAPDLVLASHDVGPLVGRTGHPTEAPVECIVEGEDLQITACYGVDTDVLMSDIVKLLEAESEAERRDDAATKPPLSNKLKFWKS